LTTLTSEFLSNFRVTPHVLTLTAKISEYLGKQELFQRQVPQVLDTLRESAIIQSTESSNRIEGIVISSRRLHALINNDSERPQTRSEAEIAGYRDVLKTIHEHHEHLEIGPNIILQLHRDLMRYTGTGGKWKMVDNRIEERLPDGSVRVRFNPTPAWRTPEAMEELCRSFRLVRDAGQFPAPILIAGFVLDFLCIHPFPDGNGRMARLLTLLLLYQSGFIVGRYISLEKVIEDTKKQYYETLEKSSKGWHEAKHDFTPWLEYFLTMLLEAYHRFEERVGKIEETQKKGWKRERILKVIDGFVADFTISDVEELCPGISRPTITRTLNELGKKGVIECIERGRHARWIKKR
jgi:Fic family protein